MYHLSGSGSIRWPFISPETRLVKMVDVPVDVLLSVPMFLRSYLLCRFMVLHSKQFQVRTRRIYRKSGSKPRCSHSGCGHALHRCLESDLDGLSIRHQDDDGGPSTAGANRLHRLLLDMHVVDVHAVWTVGHQFSVTGGKSSDFTTVHRGSSQHNVRASARHTATHMDGLAHDQSLRPSFNLPFGHTSSAHHCSKNKSTLIIPGTMESWTWSITTSTRCGSSWWRSCRLATVTSFRTRTVAERFPSLLA